MRYYVIEHTDGMALDGSVATYGPLPSGHTLIRLPRYSGGLADPHPSA